MTRPPGPPGIAAPVGRFRYAVASDRWWWSQELLDMHGLPPGTRPTTAQMMAHKHPEDREHSEAAFRARVRDGAPFATMHRIVDTGGRQRWIVAVGEGVRGEDGAVVELTGYVVDVTDRQIRALAERAATAVDAVTASRAAIEQAKGALMLVYGIGPDEAFGQLVWQSQHANVKLRELAERLVTAVSGEAQATAARSSAEGTWTTLRQRLDEVFFRLAEPPGRPPETTPAAAEAPGAGELVVTRRARAGCQVVQAAGDVDMATAARLEAALADAARRARAPGAVVVDLTEVRYLGSVGVSLLTACQRRCGQAGVGLRVVASDGPARGVLSLAGTDLTVLGDLAAALPQHRPT